MGYISNIYRIIQLMPTTQKYEAYFTVNGQADEFETIVCFALLDVWEDGEEDEKYQAVVPMIKDDLGKGLAPATDLSNYTGFRELL